MSQFRYRAHGKPSAVIDLTSDTIDDEDEITILPGPSRASSTSSRNSRPRETVSTYNPPSGLNISRSRIQGRNYGVDISKVEVFNGTPGDIKTGPPSRKKRRTPVGAPPTASGSSLRAGSSSTRPRVDIITISDDDESPPPQPVPYKREQQHPDTIPSSSSRAPLPSSSATASANCGLKRKRGQASAASSPAPLPKETIFHRLLTPPLFDKEVVQRIAEEDEYDNFHAGFDLSNSKMWEPVKYNENKVTAKTSPIQDRTSQSSEASKEAKRIQRNREFRIPDISRPTFSSALKPPGTEGKSRPGPYIWDILGCAENYRWSRSQRPRPLAVWEYSRARDPLNVAVDLHGLKRTASFKECPGSIVSIEQRKGWVAIAGASIGGAEDTPNEVPDRYNREGSLITWYHPREKQVTPLLGHQANRNGAIKYYGIHDVKFCPLDISFVSSGNDRCVHVWEWSRPPNHDRTYKLHKFEATPHALAFKPGTSTLAVAEKSVFVFPNLKRESEPLSLKGGNNYPNHVVGAICWGREATSNFLFASSEPTDADAFTGWHRAFDLEKRQSLKMDATEAGDALAVDSLGTKLMLATRVSNSSGVLRLYDIQRKDFKKAHTKITLEPYRRDIEGEIHDAALSPDGVYLALGRHDNRTHVYDSRFLGKGVLYDFRHDNVATKTVPGAESCGVMKLQWVTNGSRLGLVSGGSDGCVRLWDPLQAANNPQNGVILAEVNSDIATFSLGDRFKGEHQLVVGDCTGEVTIFDRLYEPDFALNIAA